MSISLDGKAKRSRKPEISELNNSFLAHEQVLRLEISVHHSMGVAVGKAVQNLISEGFDLFDVEPIIAVFFGFLFHVFLDVVL